jgi:hypothetical protein
MDARALAGDLQGPLGMVLGIDQQVAETVGKRHEVAFGVDDGLLHPGAHSVPAAAAADGICRNPNCPAPAGGSPAVPQGPG